MIGSEASGQLRADRRSGPGDDALVERGEFDKTGDLLTRVSSRFEDASEAFKVVIAIVAVRN